MQPELAKLGFPVIAISADRPERLTDSLKEHELGYTLYSDAPLTAARAFGIVFQMSDAEVREYLEYGIDLEEASGRDHHQLPVPSVFLVEAGGKIRWVYSNPDYEIRPENLEILEAVRNLVRTRGD